MDPDFIHFKRVGKKRRSYNLVVYYVNSSATIYQKLDELRSCRTAEKQSK